MKIQPQQRSSDSSRYLRESTSIEALELPPVLSTPGVGDVLMTEFDRMNQSLFTLDFRCCAFEDGVLRRMLHALQGHPKLRQLIINSPTQIQQQEVDALAALMNH